MKNFLIDHDASRSHLSHSRESRRSSLVNSTPILSLKSHFSKILRNVASRFSRDKKSISRNSADTSAYFTERITDSSNAAVSLEW